MVRLHGQGRRAVRQGHAVLDAEGKPVGTVTSAAFTDSDFNFIAIAAVDASFRPKVGQSVTTFRGTKKQAEKGSSASKEVDLTVLTRFPQREEKDAWRTHYKQ